MLFRDSLACLKCQAVSFKYNEVTCWPLQATNDSVIHIFICIVPKLGENTLVYKIVIYVLLFFSLSCIVSQAINSKLQTREK